MKTYDHQRSLEVSQARLLGRLEAQIEIFATSLGVPTIELAERMGHLLSPPAGGPLLGADDRVPHMRQAATPRDRVSRPLALAGSTHGKTPRNDRRVGGSGVKSYWAKMTKAERAAEMKRRAKVAKVKKASDRSKSIPAQQKLYQARYEAKRRGLPIPPLPSDHPQESSAA